MNIFPLPAASRCWTRTALTHDNQVPLLWHRGVLPLKPHVLEERHAVGELALVHILFFPQLLNLNRPQMGFSPGICLAF